MGNRPDEIETKLLDEKALKHSLYIGWQYVIRLQRWAWRSDSRLDWIIMPPEIDQDFLDDVMARDLKTETRFMERVMEWLGKIGKAEYCKRIIAHLTFAKCQKEGITSKQIRSLGIRPNRLLDMG